MAPKRTSYRKTGRVNSEPVNNDLENIGEPPKKYVYTKKNSSRIRIRKGPDYTFEHNGQYIAANCKKVIIVEIRNGWGLLQEYATNRDGWVCLEFLEDPNK